MAAALLCIRTAPRAAFRLLFILLLIACMAAPGSASASLVRQMEGTGQFHSFIDVVNRWSTEDRLDVMVLVEVNNVDLGFREEEGGLVGRLNLEVTLVGPGGEKIERTNHVRTAAMTPEEAGSSTLSTVFGVVLEDVPMRSGRLRCQVIDITRRREGVLNRYWRNSYVSRAAIDWVAEEAPRTDSGLAVEDPLFLAHAPLGAWNPDTAAGQERSSDWLHDYVHPSRRYGIEQESLQIVFPVWPPAGGVALDTELPGLRIQAFDRGMTYALNDTIRFDRRARAAMLAGRPAWVFYEMDLNQLPEGSYHLAVGPLGGEGRGLLAGFDVTWRLTGLGRHRDLILGEGRTIFSGERLRRFESASVREQELQLEEFWAENDPDPDSPVNSAYLEFQARIAYVRAFLGGFGADGALEDRGLVHLLLGPPDEIQLKHMPQNYADQDDARVKVFDRHAPDRDGTWAKGTIELHSSAPHENEGGIPMPYSRFAESRRKSKQHSATHDFGFELWRYNDRGWSLFPNRFSMKAQGARFLFVDRSGAGQYELESSNLLQGDD